MTSVLPSSALTFTQKYRFWLILLSAALIMQLPFISIPFKWLESYFHEMSHGLAAIFTGGNIVKIELFPNGAGLCTTRGGSNFLISFFGYAGAAIWGTTIYLVAGAHQRLAQIFSGLLALLIIVTLIFWVRDVLSFIIIASLLLIILLKFKFSKLSYLQVSLQITGALVLLNSVKSPWYLLDGRSLGDGAALSKITGLPEILWVFIWFAIGISGMIVLAKNRV
jgi:hypothetical protein